MSQSDLSTSIRFHSILSHYDPFWSKPPLSDLSYPIMFHSKTSILQSQYDSLMPLTFHSVFSCCDLFCYNPSWSDYSPPVMLYIKTSMLRSIQFLSVSFCLNMIHFLPSSFMVYCHVEIHSVPSRPDQIHHNIPHHVPYWNLHISIHSVPLCPNLICRLLLHSIVYCQVAIHSVPIRHNRVHYLLPC